MVMAMDGTKRIGGRRRIAAATLALLALGGLAAATAHALSKKKALSLFYTKEESDARYLPSAAGDLYAAKSDVYTKAEADGTFATSADVYTKAEADAQFAPAGDAYTKAESDARYAVRIWATVAANGSLIRGFNTAPGTSKTGTGQYEVKFNQAINGCAKTVTLYGATFGQITVLDHGSDPAKVVVWTANAAGTATDQQFHLIVIC